MVVNAKTYGAKGDGTTNDTAALQAAVNAVAGSGGTLIVPMGVYMLDAVVGLQLKSQMTLQMQTNAVLRAIPNNKTGYNMVNIFNANNVNVLGGTIEGERFKHMGTAGEWGHCLVINRSTNVVVEDVTAKECWGDGFYVGGAATKAITFCKVVADRNRRQGMSITSVDGLQIYDSVFKNTAGTEPEAGLDIEPNLGSTVTNVLITRSLFDNNAGGGMQIGPAGVDKATTFVTKTIIDGNTFTNNGIGALSPPNAAINLSSSSGNTLRNNTITGNVGSGITVVETTGSVVTGNTITGTLTAGSGVSQGAGIVFDRDAGSVCTNNSVKNNAGHGIFKYLSDAVLNNNVVTGNSLAP